MKDIEKLRELLRIEKWHVFGGSWVRSHLEKTSFPSILTNLQGSTLSLAYSQVYSLCRNCRSLFFNANGLESPRSRQKSSPQVSTSIIFSLPEIKARYFRGIFTLRKRYNKFTSSWLPVHLFIWTANSSSFIKKAHHTCSQKHGEEVYTISGLSWRLLIRLPLGMNILLWSLSQNDAIWCWPIMPNWTLPMKGLALKRRKHGRSGSTSFFLSYIWCPFLDWYYHEYSECGPQNYMLIPNMSPTLTMTFLRREDLLSHIASHKSTNPTSSAFARIENHYFVNEVCNSCSSLLDVSLTRS